MEDPSDAGFNPMFRGTAPTLPADPANLNDMLSHGSTVEIPELPDMENPGSDTEDVAAASDTDDGASGGQDEMADTLYHSFQVEYDQIISKISFVNQELEHVNGVVVTGPGIRRRSLSINQRLQYIIDTPDDYTLVDVYYLLSRLAEEARERELETVSYHIATLIQYHSNFGITGFNSLRNIQEGRENLLALLRELRDTPRPYSAGDNGTTNGTTNTPIRTLHSLFGSLYSNLISIAEAEFRQAQHYVNSHSEPDIRPYSFLYDLSVIASYDSPIVREVRHPEENRQEYRYLEESRLGYAVSRVLSFRLPGNQNNLGESHTSYVVFSALVAVYLAFLGESNEATRRLDQLAATEPAFNSEEQNISIVDRVINSVFRMLDMHEQTLVKQYFIEALSLMVCLPHHHRAPRNMLLASNLDVLRAVRNRLNLIYRENPGSLSLPFNLPFNQMENIITDEEKFKQQVLQPHEQKKEKAQNPDSPDEASDNSDEASGNLGEASDNPGEASDTPDEASGLLEVYHQSNRSLYTSIMYGIHFYNYHGTLYLSVTHSIRLTDVYQALELIINKPDDYTLVDVYFVLSQLAAQAGENQLSTVSSNIATLIQYHAFFRSINFNSLRNVQEGRENLLASLRELLDTQRPDSAGANGANGANGATNTRTLLSLFGNVYSNLIAIAEAEFRQAQQNVSSSSERVNMNYNYHEFLHEIAIFTSYYGERCRYLEESRLGYAMSRVLSFFNRLECQNSPEENHTSYVLFSSLVAVYLAFLGENEEANRRLNELAVIEPDFNSEGQNISIVSRVINSIFSMLDKYEVKFLKEDFISRLSQLICFPHDINPPRNMLLASNPGVLRAAREQLDSIYQEAPTESFFLHISETKGFIINAESFEQQVLQPLEEKIEREKKREEDDEKDTSKDTK
ncbi:hypothetical protein NX722_07600 [Endozoicomonas gorgoniicola]|uniref:Uncharacterized protein n=1 Tax=Endozoicomonas gorgoniicola TaxID=1234144 RepID=A0ABT3MT19_9GAMM|nr:hypothetical protein [Endozoicomonas gorgoniicola]MCW7552512.1 hypothetical protein [Endozoicomonas gorgoniicola]